MNKRVVAVFSQKRNKLPAQRRSLDRLRGTILPFALTAAFALLEALVACGVAGAAEDFDSVFDKASLHVASQKLGIHAGRTFYVLQGCFPLQCRLCHAEKYSFHAARDHCFE